MDEPAFPGCLVQASLLGVLEGDRSTARNASATIAVANENHSYAKIKKIGDLPREFLRELEDFFVNYHKLEGKKYKLLGIRGQKHAMTLIKQARKAV